MTETEQLRNRVNELETILGVESDDVESLIRWAIKRAVEIQTENIRQVLGVGNETVSQLLAVLDATPQQCEIIAFMLKREVATKEAIHSVLFGTRPECDQPDASGKLIDVQVVRIKRALAKHGIEIQTKWGYGGWSISRADKAKLKALMAGEAAAAVA